MINEQTMNKFKLSSTKDVIELYDSSILNKYASDDMLISKNNYEHKCYLFCYGSNSLQQIKKRVNNNKLISQKAYLPNYSLIFAGKSNKWNGGVASIIKIGTNDMVKGSIVYLTESEFVKLDKFEGSTKNKNPFSKMDNLYRRQYIIVKDKDNNDIQSIAYIKNNQKWMEYPSNEYLEAIKSNLIQHWDEYNISSMSNKITIIDSEMEIKGIY